MTCTCKQNDACSECPPDLKDILSAQAKLVDRLQRWVNDTPNAKDARELSVALGVAVDKLLAIQRETRPPWPDRKPVVWNTTGTSNHR